MVDHEDNELSRQDKGVRAGSRASHEAAGASSPKASIPDARPNRKMPDPWFRAQASSTTLGFITMRDERPWNVPEDCRQLGRFVLPPFQRPPVWTRDQQISFIESCWMRLPLGVFVYNQGSFGSRFDGWLVDGQQRITAICGYVADEFPVFGYRYSELTDVDHRLWHMGIVFPALITQIEDEGLLQEIYERLAYGGTPHAPKGGKS